MTDTGTEPSATGGTPLTIPAHAVANLRRSMLVAVPLGIVGIALTALVGHPLAGAFVCAGLALGGLNSWLLQRSVARYAVSGADHGKRRFVGGVFGRLGLFTMVGLAVALLVRPDGVGVVAGLAVFQVLMLASASMPLIRELRGA